MKSLSEEWERIDADYLDKFSKNYLFAKEFQEVLVDVIEWKYSI
jgi:hypothetical protein